MGLAFYSSFLFGISCWKEKNSCTRAEAPRNPSFRLPTGWKNIPEGNDFSEERGDGGLELMEKERG
jgi:hypothetical protein